jgi:hypothetical protein
MIISDVINATAAIAENIDTMFISKIDYEKTSTRSCNLLQMTILIIISCILFEEIEVTINDEKILLRGSWEGKTPLEWLTDCIGLYNKP